MIYVTGTSSRAESGFGSLRCRSQPLPLIAKVKHASGKGAAVPAAVVAAVVVLLVVLAR